MNPVATLRDWRSNDGTSGGTNLYLWCEACQDLHAVEVAEPARKWEWDGNLERPTISPSLLVQGVQWPEGHDFHKPGHAVEAGAPTRCHSFVVDGQWDYLGDSTHRLAGQKVPLPPLPDWAPGVR